MVHHTAMSNFSVDQANTNKQLFNYVEQLNKFLESQRDPKKIALAKKIRRNLQEQRRSLLSGSSCLFPNFFVLQADSLLSDI